MAKEEEKDLELEGILKETKAPETVTKKDNVIVKVAKLTGRTISSLKTKIKEKRLSKAFEKYNATWRKMREGMIEEKRLMEKEGKNINDSEVVVNAEKAASYIKRLANLSVRILDEEIKKAAKISPSKGIKIPRVAYRIFPNTMSKIHDYFKAKALKAATKEYIKEKLENQIYENSEEKILRKKPDASINQALKLDSKGETFEEKIAKLRKFISADGKTPLYGDEEIGPKDKPSTNIPPTGPTRTVEKEEKQLTEEELLGGLAKKEKTADEEPGKKVESTGTSEVRSKVTEEGLMKGLGPTSVVEPPKPDVKPEEKGVSIEEKTTEESQKAEEVTPVPEFSEEHQELLSSRSREMDLIISLGKTIETLQLQAWKTSDPETKKAIESYIEEVNKDLSNIIKESLSKHDKIEEKEEPKDFERISTDVTAEEVEEQVLTPIEIKPKDEPEKTETTVTGDTIFDEQKRIADGEEYVKQMGDLINKAVRATNNEEKQMYIAQQEELKKEREKQLSGTTEASKGSSMEHVEVKESESIRAEQISTPSTLSLSQEELGKMLKTKEERHKEVQSQVSTLIREKEELLVQKAMVERLIELDKAEKEGVMQVQNLTEETTALKGEVDDLVAQAAPIMSELGLAKK